MSRAYNTYDQESVETHVNHVIIEGTMTCDDTLINQKCRNTTQKEIVIFQTSYREERDKIQSSAHVVGA